MREPQAFDRCQPVTAMRYTGENLAEIRAWVQDRPARRKLVSIGLLTISGSGQVWLREGNDAMSVDPTDWIILVDDEDESAYVWEVWTDERFREEHKLRADDV